MQAWSTSAMIVGRGTTVGLPERIASWFLHRDGGDAKTFHQAVKRALELSRLTATEIKEGNYPFFTIVDPTDHTAEAMERFASSLYGLPITGSYCDSRERGLIKGLSRARVVEVTRDSKKVEFRLCSDRPFHGQVGKRQAGVVVEVDGREAFVQAIAANDYEIARRIRLAANVLHVRLDPRDDLTKTWVGEPLI